MSTAYIIKALLNNGANSLVKDIRDQTPLDVGLKSSYAISQLPLWKDTMERHMAMEKQKVKKRVKIQSNQIDLQSQETIHSLDLSLELEDQETLQKVSTPTILVKTKKIVEVPKAEDFNERPAENTGLVTLDGHIVSNICSKKIDDWLYNNDLVHRLDPEIQITRLDDTNVFYIKKFDVYIVYCISIKQVNHFRNMSGSYLFKYRQCYIRRE
jgi:hypothetical protein